MVSLVVLLVHVLILDFYILLYLHYHLLFQIELVRPAVFSSEMVLFWLLHLVYQGVKFMFNVIDKLPGSCVDALLPTREWRERGGRAAWPGLFGTYAVQQEFELLVLQRGGGHASYLST